MSPPLREKTAYPSAVTADCTSTIGATKSARICPLYKPSLKWWGYKSWPRPTTGEGWSGYPTNKSYLCSLSYAWKILGFLSHEIRFSCKILIRSYLGNGSNVSEMKPINCHMHGLIYGRLLLLVLSNRAWLFRHKQEPIKMWVLMFLWAPGTRFYPRLSQLQGSLGWPGTVAYRLGTRAAERKLCPNIKNSGPFEY